MAISWPTRKDLFDEVKQIIHEESTDLDSLLNSFISDGHRQLEGDEDWDWLLVPNASIKLVQGQEAYALPENFHKMQSGGASGEGDYILYNGTDKLWFLSEWEWKSKFSTNLLEQGTPSNYRLLGDVVGVKNQPTSPSKLIFQSTDPSDTQEILIKGTLDGLEIYEVNNLEGLTPVDSKNEFASITGFSISDKANGNVYCYSNSGTVKNVILNPGEKAKLFQLLRISPIPDEDADGNVVNFSHYKYIPDLIHNNDVSIIPNPVYLKSYVRLRAYEFQHDNANAQTANALMTAALQEMEASRPTRRHLRDMRWERANVRNVR